MPAFNAGRFIRRTIDSILAQTCKDYEIIPSSVAPLSC
ncbi:MAG: glycosyltransferase [Planctomycetota bacterium]